MKRIVVIVLAGVCIASLIFSSTGFANIHPGAPVFQATATPAPVKDVSTRLDEFFTQLAKSIGFSGSVLIARDGKVLLSKGYGMADLEHDVPNKSQTKFRLGSITKQFTAMAILILQAQGKLNVKDRICQYFEKCPETWGDVTIHQLLTHTSGIPNFTEAYDYAQFKRTPHTSDELLVHFKDKPLNFQSGTEFRYSNSGYVVLGAIIEKASGTGYKLFLQKSIFEPLKMYASGYDTYTSILKNRAEGYVSNNIKADYIDMSVPYAAGALYSTVEDLYLWDQALSAEKLVPKKLLTEMFKPHVKADWNPKASYGYGWVVDRQLDRMVIEHGGGIEGFRTEIMRFPDEQVTLIVLSNREQLDPYEIATAAAKLVFGEA